jgi:hypothetical protein
MDRLDWREKLSYRAGVRRALAGNAYRCPWWANEPFYRLAYRMVYGRGWDSTYCGWWDGGGFIGPKQGLFRRGGHQTGRFWQRHLRGSKFLP